MSGSNNYGTFTQWNTTQQKERKNSYLLDSMDGSGEIMLSEINQLAKDKYHMILLIRET